MERFGCLLEAYLLGIEPCAISAADVIKHQGTFLAEPFNAHRAVEDGEGEIQSGRCGFPDQHLRVTPALVVKRGVPSSQIGKPLRWCPSRRMPKGFDEAVTSGPNNDGV